MNSELPDFYFDTHFLNDQNITNFPSSFAIITAYATTGEQWSEQQNADADGRLKKYLDEHFSWVARLTGFSPESGHSELGWAVNIDWQEACDIGLSFKQDAIYYVATNRLSVSFCDKRRKLITIGDFSNRVQSS